jgi:DNA-binding Xre family transcriptional regulator
MSGHWRSKMPRLVKLVQVETGKRPTQTDIHDATGIRQATISEWMNPDTKFSRLDGKVVSPLLAYFNQFFKCTVDDLVEFEMNTQEIKTEAEKNNPTPEPVGA